MRDEYHITCVGFCGGSSGGDFRNACDAHRDFNGCRDENEDWGLKGLMLVTPITAVGTMDDIRDSGMRD